jgi:hypothetical protein
VIGRLPETDPDASTITASPTSISAEGDSISRITVQLKDANGNITTSATVGTDARDWGSRKCLLDRGRLLHPRSPERHRQISADLGQGVAW